MQLPKKRLTVLCSIDPRCALTDTELGVKECISPCWLQEWNNFRDPVWDTVRWNVAEQIFVLMPVK